jgi:hypothetical protein
MTARTAWTPGIGAGGSGGWVTAIASANMASLANGSSVMDPTDITNGTALDIFADISINLLIASSTIVSGAGISVWIYMQNQDNTYGDNKLTTSGAAVSPSIVGSCGPFTMACFPGATQTTIISNYSGIQLPFGTFRWAIQNNSGFALTSGTQTVKYRTYNVNLNS